MNINLIGNRKLHNILGIDTFNNCTKDITLGDVFDDIL